jgi:hypothetical protein
MVVLPARGVKVRVPYPNNRKSKDPRTGVSIDSKGRATRREVGSIVFTLEA